MHITFSYYMQVLLSCWINFRVSCLGGTDGNIQKRQNSPEETIRWKTPSTRCEMSHMLFHPIRFESAARLLLPYTMLVNELTSYYLCLGQSHPFVIYHWWLIVIISHVPNDSHVLDRSPPGQESSSFTTADWTSHAGFRMCQTQTQSNSVSERRGKERKWGCFCVGPPCSAGTLLTIESPHHGSLDA